MLIINKIARRLRAEFVSYFKSKSYYPKTYKAYWHFRFLRNNDPITSLNYYCAIPNPGAGIGHQMANWIAGYWYAQQFGLRFVHVPFSNKNWDNFLGFGEDEIGLGDLYETGYKKVRLPLFIESKLSEIALQKIIIKSYENQKVVFVAEQDQYYRDQFGVIEDIKKKFYKANARKVNQLRFDPSYFNIAIHVRRGDIVIGQDTQNPNLLRRWQDNDYFKKVLLQVTESIKTEKPLAVYLFSQGEQKDFLEFEEFLNMHYCLDWSAQDSFLHMVYADLLITSKSSFSYKPALLSNGIKICPKDFWHGYPTTDDWIMVDKDGAFDDRVLKTV